MDSTLFGHKKGAFTGATADTAGKVQEAEAGTLFLDEVGDLSENAQARLLRFFNDQSTSAWESKERRADVRIVAATNRALEQHVRAGRFREDLLFRLNVVSLVPPPPRSPRGHPQPRAALPRPRSFAAAPARAGAGGEGPTRPPFVRLARYASTSERTHRRRSGATPRGFGSSSPTCSGTLRNTRRPVRRSSSSPPARDRSGPRLISR
ncbi:MAG: sigma-54 factor interaction domain-containing protein [Myxococcota bacterium]|nr:sigma-54 factor interaction domain-containing protein [Myxococcota bacterium]